ncbi:hypothetical protein BC832DRAFT_532368 [Gaertneriomyces semiglobifer]|nr:hypothetical protein BC832DRAFT_532368 [Gaertneriomyces semiglobifer]
MRSVLPLTSRVPTSTFLYRQFRSPTHPLHIHHSRFPKPWHSRCITRHIFTGQTSEASRTDTAADETLRRVFDDPSYWNTHGVETSANPTTTGLLGFRLLTHPEGFAQAGEVALREIRLIIEKVQEASRTETATELHKTVKRLDKLSDILCSVLDTAELVRNVHPDRTWVRAADSVHVALNSFMNELNTNRELYAALQKGKNIERLSQQARRVADLLSKDFEKSGIHMDVKHRRRYVELQDRIDVLAQKMVMNPYPAVREVGVDDVRLLEGLPDRLIRHLTTRSRKAVIPTTGPISASVLKMVRNEEVRKKLYVAMNSGSPQQIEVLEELLQKRGELARTVGKETFAHYCLADKMVQRPEHVSSFLEALHAAQRPSAIQRLQTLRQLKHRLGSKSDVQIWDRLFLSQFIPSPVASDNAAVSGGANLSHYFTAGSVFAGLSKLFQALYGITLEPTSVSPSEAWHPDVRKLQVVHETEGLIGVIYCDLYRRKDNAAHKFEGSAHFTVRCSRRVDDEEHFSSDYQNGVMRIPETEKEFVQDGKLKRFQLPVVVLVTPFERPRDGHPSLLNLWQIETIFHEMGHAMHSMLARTSYQHISGTRVPMDFVEVPSILMEQFARSPSFISSVSRHYQTHDRIPPHILDAALGLSHSKDPFESLHQLQLAMLDQMYHSSIPIDTDFDSTKTWMRCQDSCGVFPPVETPWQVQFSHLSSYGATYYSYIWSGRWARRIFRRWFEGRPVDQWKEGGEMLRNELFGVGGGRDPWIGLEKVGVVVDGEREGVYTVDSNDIG